MAKTALITGASGGIGEQLARIFAREGYNLVLVARSADRLLALANALQSRYGVTAQVLPKDLTRPGAPEELFAELKDTAIDALVNNAGYATYGPFVELDARKDIDEIQLNVVTLTHLSRLFLPGMVERKSGRILNVASTAGFMPGPLMAVYYATKAYVVSFSEALAEELRGSGVTVTALCPGPTQTGFQARAAMTDSRLVQGGLMSAQRVAEAGYRGMVRGKRIVVPGFLNKISVLLPRLLPRSLMTRLVRAAHQRVES